MLKNYPVRIAFQELRGRSYVYGGHTFNYLLDKDGTRTGEVPAWCLDLIFLCIAALAAGSEQVFQFLSDFRRSFEKQSRTLNGANRGAELTRMLRDLIASYNEERSSKVKTMEQELEDVTDMMRDNISKVMERGERIESLIDKTSALKSESVSFRDKARRHNDALWWRDQRGRMILGVFLLCLMVIGFWYWQHHRLPAAPAPE
ncbi:unnamed protein product [Prorocentrum cordatum]|uniref:V-SNARE coiled-coil homology domain-containing protein n=1 Tax=Prorocentrum cordatum TaxID=2364126 RepID=A0ABN9U876_9DINO|nr:unnamed protein product [Polarella glacialis]